jgi:hypothetical protein
MHAKKSPDAIEVYTSQEYNALGNVVYNVWRVKTATNGY